MEQYAFLFPLSFFGLFAGFVAYRWFRFGSLLGASIGARVKRTVGEVGAEKVLSVRKTLKVHVLERELGQPLFVAISKTTSGMGSWQFRVTKLGADEARRLARMLDEAAGGSEAGRAGKFAP